LTIARDFEGKLHRPALELSYFLVWNSRQSHTQRSWDASFVAQESPYHRVSGLPLKQATEDGTDLYSIRGTGRPHEPLQ
jgi:hypothetical protein